VSLSTIRRTLLRLNQTRKVIERRHLQLCDGTDSACPCDPSHHRHGRNVGSPKSVLRATWLSRARA
jgi:hypothetical protein